MEDTLANAELSNENTNTTATMAPQAPAVETPVATEAPAAPRRRGRGNFRSFEDALTFARSLNLKSRKEWRLWIKGELKGIDPKPSDVPAHPDGVYKIHGWEGWRHWLGTQQDDKK